MSDPNPVFRSPITIMSAPTTQPSNLTLSDLSGVPVILVQGEAGELLKQYFAQIPAKPGDLVAAGDGLLARLTPVEFYLFGLSANAKLPSAAALDESLVKTQRFAQATDYTHGKAVVRLVGEAAPELLSKVCGLDFYDTVFPNLHVAQSSAAKIKALIARYDDNKRPTYFLHVNRPLGQYFWEVIWDAGQEFGITSVDG